MARPVVARLLALDSSRPLVGRATAALGLIGIVLALSVLTDPLSFTLLALAGAALVGCAWFAADRPALVRFIAVNAVVIAFLGWATTEQADLVIERSPQRLTVSLEGVELGASLAPGRLLPNSTRSPRSCAPRAATSTRTAISRRRHRQNV